MGQVIGLISILIGFVALIIYYPISTEVIHVINEDIASIEYWLRQAESGLYYVNPNDIIDAKEMLISLELLKSSVSIGYSLIFLIIGLIAWLLPWFIVRKIATFPIGLLFNFDLIANPTQRNTELIQLIPYMSDTISLYFSITICYLIVSVVAWFLDWKRITVIGQQEEVISQEQEDEITPSPAIEMKHCIFCGSKIPKIAEYCEKCGRKVKLK